MITERSQARGSRWSRHWLSVSLALLMLVGASVALVLWTAGGFVVLAWSQVVGLLAALGLCALLLLLMALVDAGVRRWVAVGSALALLAAGGAFWRSLASLPTAAVEIDEAGETAQVDDRLRLLHVDLGAAGPVARGSGRAARDRFVDLLAAVEKSGADIVLLQGLERVVGYDEVTQRVAERLGLWRVYARAGGSLERLGAEHGLGVLSRYPIRAAERLVLEPRVDVLERQIAIAVEVELGPAEIRTFVATDLASGDPAIAEAQAADLMRQLGSREILAIAGGLTGDSEAADTEASAVPGAFRESGFVDLERADRARLLLSSGIGEWSPLWSEPSPGSSNAVGPLVELVASRSPQHSRWSGEWRSGSPADHGFDEQRLEQVAADIGELEGVTSLLMVHGGELLVERYFRGARPEQLRNLKSASKSVLSALVGIAVDEGYLDLDTPIAMVLPGSWSENDPGKGAIAVRHLLAMTSGLESTSFRAYGAWVSSRDWVEAALRRPLVRPPGEQFRYSTGNSHILSAALTASTDESTLDFARRRLFGPMGITQVSWERDPRGIYVGGNNLAMRSRDMAKFGLLYLDRGRWGDRQLVPWEWVDASTRPMAVSSWSRSRYGYLWWMRPADERGAYNAAGYGGQYIYVSRAWDVVIVVTSSEVAKGRQWRRDLFGLIRDGILAGRPPAHHRGFLPR